MNCKQATEAIEKKELNALGHWQRLKLQWHLLNCAICRNHARFNEKLSSALRKSTICTRAEGLEVELKSRILESVEKQIKE